MGAASWRLQVRDKTALLLLELSGMTSPGCRDATRMGVLGRQIGKQFRKFGAGPRRRVEGKIIMTYTSA